MDIVHMIKEEHTRTNILFDKLESTSESALKTRDRLFNKIKTGLEVQRKVAQDLVYPVLRRHDETRELVPDQKERSDLRRRLHELEQTPKEDQQFLPRVKEFRKVVQQHLREQERQIFPAIKKAIGREEAEELATRIAQETKEGWQKAMQSENEDDEEAQPGPRKHGPERTEAANEATRFFKNQSAENTEMAIGQTTEFERQAAGMVAEAGQAAQVYNEAGQRLNDEVQTLLTLPNATLRAVKDLSTAWTDWYGRELRRSGDAARELLSCSSPRRFAEVQTRYMSELCEGLIQQSAEVLSCTQRASEGALNPLQAYVRATEREKRRVERERRSMT